MTVLFFVIKENITVASTGTCLRIVFPYIPYNIKVYKKGESETSACGCIIQCMSFVTNSSSANAEHRFNVKDHSFFNLEIKLNPLSNS